MKFFRVWIFLALVCPLSAASDAEATQRLKEIVEDQRRLFAKAESEGEAYDRLELQSQLQQIGQRYDALLREYKEFAPAYVAYGMMLNQAGMRRESVAMLLRANQIDRDIPLVKNQLGNYLAEEGKPLEAFNYFLAAVKLKPQEPLYHFQIATLLREARDDFLKSGGDWTRDSLDAAMQNGFAEATRLAPEDWRYAYQYGLSFYELETPRWAEALAFWQDFEKRLKPGVEQQVCRLHQAKVLHALGRTGEAKLKLDTVTEPALATQKKAIAGELAAAPAQPDPTSS